MYIIRESLIHVQIIILFQYVLNVLLRCAFHRASYSDVCMAYGPWNVVNRKNAVYMRWSDRTVVDGHIRTMLKYSG